MLPYHYKDLYLFSSSVTQNITVLYVISFYSLYYYHHYDHCIVNIVILNYMQTWKLYIIKRIYCLPVCLCDSR